MPANEGRSGSTSLREFAAQRRGRLQVCGPDRATRGCRLPLQLGDNLTAGMAASWESKSVAGNGALWSASGETAQIGGMVARTFGRLALSSTVSWGTNSMSSERSGVLPYGENGNTTTPFTATLTREIGTFSATGTRHSPDSTRKAVSKTVVDLGITNLFAQPSNESAWDQWHSIQFLRRGTLVGASRRRGWQKHLLDQHAPSTLRSARNRSYLTGRSTYVRATFEGAPMPLAQWACRSIWAPCSRASLVYGSRCAKWCSAGNTKKLQPATTT